MKVARKYNFGLQKNICCPAHLVSQSGTVAVEAGHVVGDVDVVALVQHHLVGGRSLPVPVRPHLHPVVEADDGPRVNI